MTKEPYHHVPLHYRTSVYLTERTANELEFLVKKYGENQSRLISRLINESFLNEGKASNAI